MFYIITETYTDIYIKKKNCKNYLVILRAVYSGNFCSLLLKEGDACRTKAMKTLLKQTTKGVNYNLQSNYNQELS